MYALLGKRREVVLKDSGEVVYEVVDTYILGTYEEYEWAETQRIDWNQRYDKSKDVEYVVQKSY